MNSNKIKARMVELGLTQLQVAVKMSINVSTLNAKINDSTGQRLTVREANQLADILNIKIPENIFFAN